ncbi:hypothetical protein FISHEDRAFT_39425, partial [Fistulina hepatica ATCC 64428]
KPSIDQGTLEGLERRLSNRPEKSDLVDRGILKDDKGVAPSLIAAREKLKRSQLEDKLGNALQHRPKPDELVDAGILQGPSTIHDIGLHLTPSIQLM